jgi:putative ABC transport system substrate-binding protein
METDPVETGLIASYARPGGNVTGLFLDVPSLATKWIELIREAVPRLERIAFAWQPSTGRSQLDIALRAAQAMQIEAVILEIEPSVDFASKFSRLASAKPTGIVQLTLPGGSVIIASYAAAAERHGLPSITFSRAGAKAGSLMSYGPSQEAYYPRAVEIAGRILGGDKVGEIPIERPFKFEFVIIASGKSRKGGRDVVTRKPFIAVQRVRLPPGKGEPASRKRALRGWWQHHSRSVGSMCLSPAVAPI